MMIHPCTPLPKQYEIAKKAKKPDPTKIQKLNKIK
jgi:hypothetical protein